MQVTIGELIGAFLKFRKQICTHTFFINHQFKKFRLVKERSIVNNQTAVVNQTAVTNISENYTCKHILKCSRST